MTPRDTGHPLPESGEARHNEIPEELEREKGRGEEGEGIVQPRQPAVNPDGEPYRYDLGRGPGTGGADREAGTAPDPRSFSRDEEEKDMTGENDRNSGRSGSDLQQSQSGGGSGEFGGNRDQRQAGQEDRQQGGGASRSDMGQAGGSSGSGGYGNAQNQASHQGQQGGGEGRSHDPQQSRGERFDERQGGGRGADSLGADRQLSQWDREQGTAGRDQQGEGEIERDQRAHQDRGQGDIGSE